VRQGKPIPTPRTASPRFRALSQGKANWWKLYVTAGMDIYCWMRIILVMSASHRILF